jgi:hypothetical protein
VLTDVHTGKLSNTALQSDGCVGRCAPSRVRRFHEEAARVKK